MAGGQSLDRDQVAALDFGPTRSCRGHRTNICKMTIHAQIIGAASENIPAGMILIPSGTFRMGSDRHYPEEAPVHRVTVDSFWIDRTPVTNRQFKDFVRATGYVTAAEIPPDPKSYPGALPHMLYAGSLVFTPPQHLVDLSDWSQWWQFMKGATWPSLRPAEQHQRAR